MLPDLKDYISSFNEKLHAISVADLSLDAYPAKYLQHLIDNSLYYLHIYADCFKKLLENLDKSKEEIVLVDYGAGNGLLGLFAKCCGFKKVYLNDYNETFLEASRQLSKALHISIDGFIKGDCNAVAGFCSTNEIPHAIVGTDVIEHIYSLDKFFSCLRSINKKIVTVFTTASVTSNPIKNRQLIKLQKTDEFVGSNAEHAIPGDEFAGLPFLEIRKKIIKNYLAQLNDEDVNRLAVATRGLRKEDIINSINEFISSHTLPIPPSHPSNTCDPITGSWTERLLTPSEYTTIYERAGFEVHVNNGFYNEWTPGIKGPILKIINRLLTLSPLVGKAFAPFITLVSKP